MVCGFLSMFSLIRLFPLPCRLSFNIHSYAQPVNHRLSNIGELLSLQINAINPPLGHTCTLYVHSSLKFPILITKKFPKISLLIRYITIRIYMYMQPGSTMYISNYYFIAVFLWTKASVFIGRKQTKLFPASIILTL